MSQIGCTVKHETNHFHLGFQEEKITEWATTEAQGRLCAHVWQHQWDTNYWETYTPVANWASVRLLLALSHVHGLESKSIYFVLEFPQATLDTEVHMEILFGFERQHDEKTYVLKLKRSTHVPKQNN